MNQYITGNIIKNFREKNNMTQAELAEKLCVSDKTISKWETGKGYPDISLLNPIAKTFGISIAELLSGVSISNVNVSANMMRSKFYVCPVCGNSIHSMGEAAISCHGVMLAPIELEEVDDKHIIQIDSVEDEYYVHIEHDMTKSHYISFIAAISYDKIQMVKIYPEGNAEARFKTNGVKNIVFYCNKDGGFSINVRKALGKRKMNDYKAEVKQKWGNTDAYKEYAEKSKSYSQKDEQDMMAGMDSVMAEFASCMQSGAAADSDDAKAMVKKLQGFITDNFYTCTDQILAGLGQMYVADERFKNNIDKHGEGTAEYISAAIAAAMK